MRVDAVITGTHIAFSHDAHCPEISPRVCADPDIEMLPHEHHQGVTMLRYQTTASFGLGGGWQIMGMIPVDAKLLSIEYTTMDGEPYDPPYGDIHHRNETLFGLGDGRLEAQYFFRVAEGWVLGGGLGADVPVFISGNATWAEGVGDLLYEENGVEESILLLFPDVNVSTAKIFASPELTRDSVPIKMDMKNISEYRNDCEPVTKSLYPDIEEALEWLSQYGTAVMSGTGSTVFATFDKLEDAKSVISEIPKKWSGMACKTLNRSPLLDRIRTFNVEFERE